ncbi:MAG TPA: glutaredoxin domain-containing protein [Vicinamibacterales bacterium]|nr:glutaredoxin domain-containing protein [Vicinamibacterales bacterium]
MKEFLSRAGHGFTIRNVEEDLDAYHALLALGYRTVPVTVIDGQAVRGYDRAALEAALAAAGGS